jgi:hypothetical protein
LVQRHGFFLVAGKDQTAKLRLRRSVAPPL